MQSGTPRDTRTQNNDVRKVAEQPCASEMERSV